MKKICRNCDDLQKHLLNLEKGCSDDLVQQDEINV